MTFWQLMQPNVQNSTKTTRLFSSLGPKGLLLTQDPPVISGAGFPVEKAREPAGPKAENASAVKKIKQTFIWCNIPTSSYLPLSESTGQPWKCRNTSD